MSEPTSGAKAAMRRGDLYGAVVTRDPPPDVFAVGNPAHVVRRLDRSDHS